MPKSKKQLSPGSVIAVPTIEPMIKVPTIVLSSQESRTMFKLFNANGGKVAGRDYDMKSLLEIGLVKSVPPSFDQKQLDDAIEEAWLEIESAVDDKDMKSLMRGLDQHKKALNSKPTGDWYELTELGKQVSKGMSVRLSASR